MGKLLAFAEKHSATPSAKKHLERWMRQNAAILESTKERQLELWGEGDGEDEDLVTPEMLEAVEELDPKEYNIDEMLDETFLDLEQIIKFIEDQPYANYRRHWVDRMTAKGPQKRAYTCLETVGKTCPLCSIGDRPQAVSAFNVMLVGDDSQVMLKTWDVGARLFNVLKAYANDPKIGPLSKGYFAVSKTGAKQNTQMNVIPVRENALSEDYDITPPTAAEFKAAGKYDASIIQIPKKTDLEEIAQEISEYD
jgi:hypothetical protein